MIHQYKRMNGGFAQHTATLAGILPFTKKDPATEDRYMEICFSKRATLLK